MIFFITMQTYIILYIYFLQEIVEGNLLHPLPAALVRPTHGELHWIVDKETAKNLKKVVP